MATPAIVSHQPAIELNTMRPEAQNGQRDVENGVVANAADTPMRPGPIRACLGSQVTKAIAGVSATVLSIPSVAAIGIAASSGGHPHPAVLAGAIVGPILTAASFAVALNDTKMFCGAGEFTLIDPARVC